LLPGGRDVTRQKPTGTHFDEYLDEVTTGNKVNVGGVSID